MAEIFEIGCLADIAKIEKFPYWERVKAKSTYEIIAKGAGLAPDAPAISFIMDGDSYRDPVVIRYAQLLGRIHQTANMLHDMGIMPGDVVTYLLPNLPHTHFVLWGAEIAGIANPVNPMLDAGTIKDICVAAGTKVLVALGEYPGTDIWQKVQAIRKDIPALKAVIRVFGPSDESQGIIGYDEKIDQYPADRLTFKRAIQPDDIASLYHTGGTTGRPKLAKRTHYNEVVLAFDIAIASELQAGETVMCGLPLFHCNGTCVTGLMPFSTGGHVVLLSPAGYRDPKIMQNFWKIVNHYRPAFFSAVPTVLGVLLNIPKGDADTSSLRYALCGAAPLSVELFKKFEEKSGLKILEGYGLTETACASAVNPKDGERKMGSIGIRLPYHWIKVAVLDKDGKFLRDAETDEIGSICVSGPCVFKGYVEDIHNQGIWIDPEKKWFNTGDLGRQDADGYLWLTGRRKELIIRGGHNIDPAVIEGALYKLEGVKLAAAVGQPDAHAGEVPAAYVELTEGSGLDEAEILEWARNNIGERAAVPKTVTIIDQMPLTAVGKIFKPALQWHAIQRVYQKSIESTCGLTDSVKVTVAEDKIHGTSARITVKQSGIGENKPIEEQIKAALAHYTIHYEIAVE
ncbi:MAG: acyl-CoA synthetase [Desulfobacteraceae bacterium]|nr:MAG: acyl-CoA synthetase [Desulfobacteraceae bacterium]